MKERKKGEGNAQNRHKANAPVFLALEEGAGSAKKAQTKREICAGNQNKTIDGHKVEPVADAGLA